MRELCKKNLFQLEGVHYLNCAYMSPLSAKVEEAGIAGMRRKRIPTALTASHFFDHCEDIRVNFHKLINAPSPDTIAILPSVSYGMAIIARNTELRRGQNIVLPGGQMPSNVYQWQRVCAEEGLELRVVPQPTCVKNRGALWNEAILDRIDRQTAIVTLGNVHWLDGTRFDLQAIARKVHEGDGALVVDGTQSLGAIPFDVQEIGADAVISAGYKWLMGPYSIGAGYFGPRYLDGAPIEEPWLNRRNSRDFQNLIHYQPEYREGARRFDVGESSNFILAPMLAAAIEQLLEWDVRVISDYCRALTAQIAGRARELGFAVIDDDQRGPHYLGLGVPAGVDIADLQGALAARRVAVSVRGPFVRVTPNIYNDEEDVAALLDVLTRFRAGARP